jgi:hypothetical protein
MGGNMKKSLVVILATVVLLLGYSLPGEARFRGGVYIDPWGPWWGAPYGYGYPGYGYPYYPAPPVVIQQQPQEYVQQPAAQPEQQQYWYYCSEAKGYYPYVKKCPGGWMRVVPTPAPTPAPPVPAPPTGKE